MHRIPSIFIDLNETGQVSDRQFLINSLAGYKVVKQEYEEFKSVFNHTEAPKDSKSQFAVWAIDAGMHYLESALAYSKSLEGLIENSEHATHPAACVLLRQSLECTLIAKWIFQSRNQESLAMTGFAVTYRSLKRQRKYAIAANEMHMPWMTYRLSDYQTIETTIDQICTMGRNLGFMDTRFYVYKYLPGYSQLFHEATLYGRPISLRWIYELLSSVSHGDVLGFNPSEHEFAQIVLLLNKFLRETFLRLEEIFLPD